MLTTFNHIETKQIVFAVSSEDYKPLPSSIFISSPDDLPKFPFKMVDTDCMLSAIPENQLSKKYIYFGLRAYVNAEKFWLTFFESGLPK